MPTFRGNAYTRLPEAFRASLEPQPVRAPAWVLRDDALAATLGLEHWIDGDEALATLAGNRAPEGGVMQALAYAGHQFGHWVPLLGDGRAAMLGQLHGTDGTTFDVQLKGSGRTPYSRGGDGRATLASAVREHLVSAGIAGLGIPTARTLAALATGEFVWRESPEPGGVSVRVARSHVRVGSFEYAASLRDPAALQALFDFTVDTLDPALRDAPSPALALLEIVRDRQADLIARWMGAGFIHGVMNTDNMALSGETIDYGPCAFQDTFAAGRVFSRIDRQGRYAWSRQPSIALWNLSRLAEALLPLVDADTDTAVARATEVLQGFAPRFQDTFSGLFRRKLGVPPDADGFEGFLQETFATLEAQQVDFTLFFRRLTQRAAGDGDVAGLFADRAEGDAWLARHAALAGRADDATVAAMAAVNPVYIARNHRVEEAIRAVVEHGDAGPAKRLALALAAPFTARDDLADLEAPPAAGEAVTETHCNT